MCERPQYIATHKKIINIITHSFCLLIFFFERECVCFLTLVSSLLEGDYTLCARRLNAINQSNTIILNLGHFFLKKRKNSVCVCALYTERRESEKRKNWHFSILPQKDLEKKNTHTVFTLVKKKGKSKRRTRIHFFLINTHFFYFIAVGHSYDISLTTKIGFEKALNFFWLILTPRPVRELPEIKQLDAFVQYSTS